MIPTRLKKLQFLVYHRDYENFLNQLRDLGVAHLSTRSVKLGENEELDAMLNHTEELRLIVQQLEALKVDGVVASQIDDRAVSLTSTGDAKKGAEVAERVTCINERIKEAESRRIKLSAQAEALAPWGDFDPACRDIIAKAGRSLSFHSVPRKMWNDEWTEACPVFLINEVDKVRYFISIDEPVADKGEVLRYAGASTVDLPLVRLNDAVSELEDVQRELSHLCTDLQIIARQGLDDVTAAWKESQNKVDFDRVVYATERAAHDTLMVLTGWVPAKIEDEVRAFCEKTDAWYEISAPAVDDVVPTKMSNWGFVKLYEGLTRMYGSPDYNEFDATPMIAIFFSIFFGFCVGDAGYGLVLLLLGFPICKFLKNSLKMDINPVLVTILGGTSAAVGLLLGTAFGADLAAATPDCWYYPIVSWAQPFMIAGKVPGTAYDWQMVLAVGIGILHLSIAMFVKAISTNIKYGFRAAITSWAWWLVFVGSVAAGLPLMLGIEPELFKNILLGIGVVAALAIFVIGEAGSKWYFNPFAGLYATYNMSTGLLGDVLSYIRLYALGLAGGKLGGAFNMLAFDMIYDNADPSWGWIACGLILLLGHTLNIALSCLSAFVHPLRLTFVEYFKNSGYEGRGIMFKAFARV